MFRSDDPWILPIAPGELNTKPLRGWQKAGLWLIAIAGLFVFLSLVGFIVGKL